MSNLSPETINNLVEFLRTHPEFERYKVPIAEPLSVKKSVYNFDEPFPFRVVEIINPFFSKAARRKKLRSRIEKLKRETAGQ